MKTDKLLRALLSGCILAVAIARAHGQALPFAWGYGFYGQIGNNGSDYAYPVPVAVNTSGVLAGKTVKAMAAGTYHSLALCTDGTLVAWGAGYNGQIGSGQVGNNSTPLSLVPVAVANTALSGSALFGKTVTAISAGGQFSLALCSDGTMAAWGGNANGCLGDNTTTQRDTPVPVVTAGTALAGKTVKAITSGDMHSLALCTDGTLVTWGKNDSGQLGNNSTVSSSVAVAVVTAGTVLAGKTVTAIGGGGNFCVVLCSDGTLAAWGYNGGGQLGNNSTVDSPVPVAVTTAGTPLAGKTVTALAAGGSHTLVLCSDGTLISWGYNDRGQLGNNTLGGQSAVPVAVTVAGTPLAGKTVTAVSAGSSHSLALCSDGTLTAWGWDFHGELGDNGSTQNFSPSSYHLTPVAVIASDYFTTLFPASSAYHNLALLSHCAPPLLSLAQYAGVSVTGTVGCTYRIDYTTNLTAPVTWTPLVTNTLVSSPFLFIDTNVISGVRYYRAVVE
ncbi:MAG: cell wall anchor protein [Proteobacteria bacterium]|nr:cell wall anchor protein [Pseudomonadota bacterium]